MTTDHTTRCACTSSTKYTSDEVAIYQGLSWADSGAPARGWAGLGRPVRPGSPIFSMIGRCPAQPVNFVRGSAEARPGPSNFLRMGRDPTQPITI